LQEEADQAHPTRPNCNADEMQGQNRPVQEREPLLTLEKRGDMGANVEGIVPLAPGLQGGAGNLKPFGGLTLGDTLNLPLEILPKPVSPVEPVPTLVTVTRRRERQIDCRTHRDLLPQARTC
jgi:hypothetical protein